MVLKSFWSGHQIHIALPVNTLLDAGVDPKRSHFHMSLCLTVTLWLSFTQVFQGLAPFWTFNWTEYSDFLTFRGGLNPVTGGLWLSDTAHHHLAIGVLFIIAGHMYRTNWVLDSMKEILEAHKGPFTGEGHKGFTKFLQHHGMHSLH